MYINFSCFKLTDSVHAAQTAVGDFCMDPVNYAHEVMYEHAKTYNITQYYTTCEGTGPYDHQLNSAQKSMDQFSYQLTLLTRLCLKNKYMVAMGHSAQQVKKVLDDVEKTIYCPPFQQHIQSMFQHGVCHSGFNGIFTVWIGQHFTIFAFICLCVCCSLACYYFEWTVEKTSAEYLAPEGNTVASVDGNTVADSNAANVSSETKEVELCEV
jgi:hypothetical protein